MGRRELEEGCSRDGGGKKEGCSREGEGKELAREVGRRWKEEGCSRDGGGRRREGVIKRCGTERERGGMKQE